MKPFHGSFPKQGKPAKKKRRGMARPDEPLATWCEVAGPVCTGRAQVRHHIVLRSQGGTDEAANTVDCCDADHRYLHAHPEWATAHGWIRHSWERPA